MPSNDKSSQSDDPDGQRQLPSGAGGEPTGFARARTYMPATRIGRIAVGSALILGGVLGFLPIVGFWMLPLGLLVLSVDFPAIRKFRRRWQVRIMRWWNAKRGKQ